MINTNVNKLKSMDFSQILSRNSFVGDGEYCVFHLTLMFNKNTGEILDIAKYMKDYDDMEIAPLVIRSNMLS